MGPQVCADQLGEGTPFAPVNACPAPAPLSAAASPALSEQRLLLLTWTFIEDARVRGPFTKWC